MYILRVHIYIYIYTYQCDGRTGPESPEDVKTLKTPQVRPIPLLRVSPTKSLGARFGERHFCHGQI